MPNRTTDDDRDKLDHSTHPTSKATGDDLRAPGGTAGQRPLADSGDMDPMPDDEDRVNDFFGRHGGPGKAQRRFGGQGRLQGWSEIEALDGHVLRCDWSRMGSREEITYSEVAPAATVPRASRGVD